MIVPMKKALLLILEQDKAQALKTLRKLGLLHIEISEGSGERLAQLREQVSLIESNLFTLEERAAGKEIPMKEADKEEALAVASRIAALTEEKKNGLAEIRTYESELDRIKSWGEVRPEELEELAQQGIELIPYEMPVKEYKKLDDSIRRITVGSTKNNVLFVVVNYTGNENAAIEANTGSEAGIPDSYRVSFPKMSTGQMKEEIQKQQKRNAEIDKTIEADACYIDSMKQALVALNKDIEMETYATGMVQEAIGDEGGSSVTVAYLTGYIPTEDEDKLKACAKENAWGLLLEDPTEEDNVPTKLKNNKFVSLVYPLTDFLGTVPGYFEYDISGWFLIFMLIFFGIIFGDGGYGLLICGVAGLMILKAKKEKAEVQPLYWLVLLFGLATVIWGTVTCSWFGISADQLPQWLKNLSIPAISNAYEDTIWYPFWTNGEAGLTTAQNVQIICFALALVQLSIAHIKGISRYRHSLKWLGDLGSLLQLFGMFYVVLTLVVNGEVFGLGLVVSGVPVGTIAISLVAVGFILNFIFANYEGSIGKSIMESLKNIVSVLLDVVNVFSDIVSYIRLWAVGLAGAAISSTVNELAGPLFGSLTFLVFAIIILVFGHGLNMILNVLSLIVHGVRLNTLEFSNHLGMSWSGHKYEPFEE